MKVCNDWDKVFVEYEIVESYFDGGGCVIYMWVFLFWLLKDWLFVLFFLLSIEVDWYGKKVYFLLIKYGWYLVKFEGEDGFVWVINGGNFYVVMLDE